MNQKVIIGCIYKRAFNEARLEKEALLSKIKNLKKGGKVITFFDTSFNDSMQWTEKLFLEYLDLIRLLCLKHEDANILLKPKAHKDYRGCLSGKNVAFYTVLWEELSRSDNFICLDPLEWSAESAIAVSDVCVSMGMNSPATIALICGRNALYYDDTGNEDHYFAKKYKNALVFDNKNLLCEQITRILSGEFN